MNDFLKSNKQLFTYSLILLIVIPLFGLNFFISFLGNILLLLFLIPLLLLVLAFMGLNYYKSKIIICSNCGAISLGLNETCVNCGSDLKNTINIRSKFINKFLLLSLLFINFFCLFIGYPWISIPFLLMIVPSGILYLE